jgi:nucleoside-diphosphate-sugar epimerase
MNVLLTGATGFVGTAVMARFTGEDCHLRAALTEERNTRNWPAAVERVNVGPLSECSDFSKALAGIDVVMHLAARVHVMNDTATDALAEFRRVNVAATANLARQAAGAGVQRLVFVSSIKVLGEETAAPYTDGSVPHPREPYAVSKWEAEQELRRIEAETGLEVVVVRPPLVYGPGVKANFLSMMKLVARGYPLPLASVRNRRSLIHVGNLADALTLCARHPDAAGKTYLVSDGDDVSTPELLRRTARALGVPARLFPFPVVLLRLAAALTGNTAAVARLTGSLAVDSAGIRSDLAWRPPVTMEEGLRLTADWFRGRNGHNHEREPCPDRS